MALPHTKNIFDYPARFQFGQEGAPCNGQSCCTDTCIQMIIDFYKDDHYSLATIRRRAQNKYSFDERACTGINHLEVLNALGQFGLGHYKAGFGVDAGDVWNYVATGPVIVGVHYGSYPNENGYCGGVKAEYEGRTDCQFRGSHAVLVIGRRWHNGHRDLYVRDPDHNSPSRREKPKYDIVHLSDFNRAMRNIIPYTAFTNTYAVYPTRRK